ncbi:hypothetical protein [Amorphus orientalis]|uniref:Uncharacterized protein n=1 Tax=Amorphus orientalis TaxID=649198 RepID=A0AAE3VLR8_9HYPH|nr:hypothetical protein [Amorphus orientalis]MDQ0314814.1 hypothetical protein [Amorphus orientalis]
MITTPQIDAERARREGSEAIIRTMASTLIERWTATGAATRSDLAFAGFTEDEIDTHGQAARDRAAKLGADLNSDESGTADGLFADETTTAQRTIAQMDEAITRLSARAAISPVAGRVSG